MGAVVIQLSVFYPLQRGGVISEASVGSAVQHPPDAAEIRLDIQKLMVVE